MKKTTIIVALSTILTPSFAQSDYNCKKKEDNLTIQLRYAEQQGNVHRAESLKRAIANIRKNCGTATYQEDLQLQLDNELYIQMLHDKIAKQKDKIESAQLELREAEATGKAKKIREKSEKVQERQDKLDYYLKEQRDLLNQ